MVMSKERVQVELKEADGKRSMYLPGVIGMPVVFVGTIYTAFVYQAPVLLLIAIASAVAWIFLYSKFSAANNRYNDLKRQL